MEPIYRVLRHNVKANLYNGVASTVGINLVIPFIGVMAARMGADNTHFAMLSSVPALFSIIATLPAAFIIERFRHQKNIVAGLLTVSRICYLLLAFLPLLKFGQIDALIYTVGVYTAISSIFGVAYQSMIGEIIPIKYRNKVFAQRNIWSSIFGMFIALLAGWGIDRVPYPYGYQAAFAIGFIASLFEIWYFYRLSIPTEENNANKPDRSKPVLTLFIESWKINAGRPFYLFCASSAVYLFAWQAAWPVYLKIKADTLHATNLWISIDTVAGTLGALLGFKVWARYADRKGNAVTVFLSSLFLASTPFLFIYAPSMLIVSVYDILGGFATAGFNQSLFNRLLEIVPVLARQRAIAVYTSLSQISAVFAPIVGMIIYEHMSYGLAMSTFGTARILGAFCFLIVISPWFQQKE